jgi:drug/metabolite transporter (DMT)-like permease
MTKENQSARWQYLMPLIFVTLYGSGFVGAKLGLPYSEPLTFLMWRFACTTILLLFIALLLGVPWPRKLNEIGHIMVAGLLMLGVFSTGVFVAIYLGISPAISALIIALQPILVALGAGPVLKEKIQLQQWIGFILGLFGVFLVISHKLTMNHADVLGIGMCFLGLFGLTAGNLYQKRFCAHMNIFSGGLLQSLASGIAVFIAALTFETMQVNWTNQFVFALAWMSIVVSIGALSLLYLLIRHGAVIQVASLFYLVPVSTAVIAYFVYNEAIDGVAMLGILIIALGIMLVQKRRFLPVKVSVKES